MTSLFFPFFSNFYPYQDCLLLGLSRLCPATFENLLAIGATFCGCSNLEQIFNLVTKVVEENPGNEVGNCCLSEQLLSKI